MPAWGAVNARQAEFVRQRGFFFPLLHFRGDRGARMTIFKPEQRAMDAALETENEGSILQVLGWILLGFDSIPVVWVLVGWRTGSWLWFWITFGLVCLGAASLAAGGRMTQRAASDLAAAAEAIRHRILCVRDQQRPPLEDMESPAA